MRRIWAGIFLTLAALGLTACATQEENIYRQVSMEEGAALLASQEGYILLDVRTVEEFKQGHIPGAICIPNETIGSTAPAELPDQDQLILVYCRSGNRSKQAAAKLAALGYTNVVEFGGILDWQGPIVTE